jgi:hypothetical protein
MALSGSGGSGGGMGESKPKSSSSKANSPLPEAGIGGKGGKGGGAAPWVTALNAGCRWEASSDLVSMPSSSKTVSLLPGTNRNSFFISNTRLGTGNEANNPAMRLVATSMVVELHTLHGTISDTALGSVEDGSSFDLGRVMSSNMGMEP